jgi:hypothetical protein
MTYSKSIKKVTILSIVLFSFTAFAQNARTVNVTSFNAVGVSSGIDLHLEQGKTESLIIKGNPEVIKDVIIEQNNQSITIKYKNGVNWSRLFKGQNIDVYVTFKNLNAVAASGGSDVDNAGVIQAGKFSISSSGGADVDLNIVCKDISIATSGGADIDLRGSAENMSISASGGADVNAYNFKVNYAQVNSSGGADVNIYVEKGLTATATGGSDIRYKGNAALKKSASKSGDVTKVN